MKLTLQINWRCLFGLHPWSRWSDPWETEVGVAILGIRQGHRQSVIQDRTCPQCGKYQWREV